MNDDMNDLPDNSGAMPDASDLAYDASDGQLFSAPDQEDSGGLFQDNTELVEQLIQDQLLSGGLQTSDNADDSDMGSVLAAFDFNLDEIVLPWSPRPQNEESAMVGTPDLDAQYWQPQTTNFTCAVQAQRGIIEAFTGEQVSEAQLVYDATINGWLTEDGMSPYDVGNLLELHGIPSHAQSDGTIEDLMAELALGHKIIVGLDSGELWGTDSPLEDFFGQAADHATWVTGIDMSDPLHPTVTINDSGDPSGAGKVYDLALFKDSWKDSGFYYVATDDAPADMAFASNRGFDESAGVFSDLASYFGNLYSDFREHLQERRGDETPIGPCEIPTLFTDAGMRAFIENLPQNPLASLHESIADTLFRVI